MGYMNSFELWEIVKGMIIYNLPLNLSITSNTSNTPNTPNTPNTSNTLNELNTSKASGFYMS